MGRVKLSGDLGSITGGYGTRAESVVNRPDVAAVSHGKESASSPLTIRIKPTAAATPSRTRVTASTVGVTPSLRNSNCSPRLKTYSRPI